MFGRIYNDGSLEWLGVLDFHRTDGPAWTANILDPCPSWVDGGSTTNPNWGSQYGGASGSVYAPWNNPVHVLPFYHRRIFKNTHALLHAVFVTISFKAIVWRSFKFLQPNPYLAGQLAG